MRLTYIILIFIASLTLGLPAVADVPFYQFTPREYRLGTDFSYLSTSSNYDLDGNSNNLPFGFGYTQYSLNLNARYTWSRNLSLFSGTALRYATSETLADNKSTVNVPFLNLGVNYNLGKAYFKIIPEVKISIPIASYDMNGTETATSEGLFTTEVGANLFKDFSDFLFQSYLGYEYKTENFASLFHYQFKLYYLYESFAFTAGYLGFLSAGSDSNNDFKRATYLANNTSSSFIYNSDEPSRGDLLLQVGYVANDNTRWFVSGTKSLMGERSMDYYQFSLGLEYRFGTKKRAPVVEEVYEEIPAAIETDEEFQYPKEETDPSYEEEIKSFNKPKLTPTKKKTIKETQNELNESKKELDKYDERTKTNKRIIRKPIKPKKLKRVRINF